MSVSVTTNREIDIEQLSNEIGSNSLVVNKEGDEYIITYWGDDLTVEDLQMAVNNHIPSPTEPTLSIEERLVLAQEKLEEHQALIDGLIVELLG